MIEANYQKDKDIILNGAKEKNIKISLCLKIKDAKS